MKGLGTDKLMPEGKKREATLDVTQDANNSPKKDNNSGPAQGHFDSPVISEAGDSDGLKLSEHADKEKEKKEKEKEEIEKSLSKEEMEKHAENDANYKRKVMEEVQTMARKMSREEIEDDKKVDKKNDKTRDKKPEKAFSPILKAPAKSPDNHKSRSDSRKKKKSKIRDEINGTKRPEYIKQDDDNSHEHQPKGGGGRARTPGLDAKSGGRRHDESDEIILNMLRENREKEQQRSGRHVRAPAFDEVEHPRPRRQHELVRGGRSSEQRESPVKSNRSHKSCPKKGASEPRLDKAAAGGSIMVASGQHPPSSENKSYFPSRRRAQMIIVVLSFCLLACLVIIIIQATFISTKCTLK